MNIHKPVSFGRAAPAPARVKKLGKEKKADKPEKLSRKDYEKEMHKLQVELSYLQDWVRETGARVIIVCEGTRHRRQGGGTDQAG
jgi:polyphosphate kinase 2 (PPK2 family)